MGHILGSRYQRIERWAAVKTVSFHVYWRCESAAGGRSSQSPHALSYNFHDFAHHGYNADEETSWASILREHRKSKNDFGPCGGSIRVCLAHAESIISTEGVLERPVGIQSHAACAPISGRSEIPRRALPAYAKQPHFERAFRRTSMAGW